MNGIIVAVGIALAIAVLVNRIIVHESHVGLLYRNGRYRRELAPGRHFVWRPGSRCAMFDLRRVTLTIPAQELLSKDNIGLKITLAVSYEIGNARLAAEAVQDYIGEVYVVAQLALRSAVAQRTIDEMLGGRAEIGRQVQPTVADEAGRFGLKVHAVEIKDMMFSGELKRVFAEVARAREEGKAALEKARGESAALRNLANAGRLLSNNPGLMNLRLLQSIAAAGQGTGNTLVLGVPQGLTDLSRNGGNRSSGHGAPSGES